MKQMFLRTTKAFLLIALISATSCKKTISEPTEETSVQQSAMNIGPVSLELTNYEELADTFAYRLRYKCEGFAFAISQSEKLKTYRAWGWARKSHFSNPLARTMSMYEKMTIMSVSKTITAAALIKALSAKPGWSLDWKIWTFLPSHWQMGYNIKTITFRELLQHKAGFRDGENDIMKTDYASLKYLVSKGVNLMNKNTSFYSNRNYALMRLMIPVLANYPVQQVTPPDEPNLPNLGYQLAEYQQGAALANLYKIYCRQVIFSKLNSCQGYTIDCVNPEAYPCLFYYFGVSGDAGEAPGDYTMEAGGYGWYLNTFQMADFMRSLHYTENILPKELSNVMKDELCGYDQHGTTADGYTYFWKNGGYLNTATNRGYNSVIICFSDGVQIAAQANSQVDLVFQAIKAHEDWKK